MIKKGANAFAMCGCPPLNAVAANAPITPLPSGNAKVAIPITLPFLVGNHCPTRIESEKVAYTKESTVPKPYTARQSICVGPGI